MNWNDIFDYRDGCLFTKKRTGPRSLVGRMVGRIRPDGYVDLKINSKRVLAHRIIWEMHNGFLPDGYFVDHINHKRDDNRICNLRIVTRTENNKNASKRYDNKSGVTGVRYCKQKEKWQAMIGKDGSLIHLGFFDVASDAVRARKQAEKEFGFHENHGA